MGAGGRTGCKKSEGSIIYYHQQSCHGKLVPGVGTARYASEGGPQNAEHTGWHKTTPNIGRPVLLFVSHGTEQNVCSGASVLRCFGAAGAAGSVNAVRIWCALERTTPVL
ncbi:hypothetical protein ZHAS_00020267 [Anopheles sinensis]|uniref:Uncharacterized protein n=1 Tax=Anopheles sinensis TaxID=74873 RepID=A0A084WPB9_ANOSI|nr:hypothetical protein ZHAS_00020267 [Anopheles sinensis]